jgi:hypothetical protein
MSRILWKDHLLERAEGGRWTWIARGCEFLPGDGGAVLETNLVHEK